LSSYLFLIYQSGDTVNTFLRIRPCRNRSESYKVFKETLWVQKGSKNKDKKCLHYQFNKIFERDSDQKELFKVTALPLVREFIAGRNNLLFSYGITSSGKSFTMRGTAEHPGIIPHALVTLFDQIREYIDPEMVPECKISKFCDVEFIDDSMVEREEKCKKALISGENSNLSEEILSQIHNEGLSEELNSF